MIALNSKSGYHRRCLSPNDALNTSLLLGKLLASAHTFSSWVKLLRERSSAPRPLNFHDNSPTRSLSTMGNIETPFCPSDVYKVTPDFSNC